ncbi:MAG: radical SAM protein [Alphaproteobacteria bacterium]
MVIQATIGCSFNRCTFCSMYCTKTFQVRPRDRVFADIETAARAWPEAHRVFLADGDALVLPTDEMLAIFDKLAASFPNLARVSSYAILANLVKKSVDELAALKRAKLTLLYYGLESGDAGILRRVTKGASPRAIIQGLGKARDAGLKISATVILGLGGRAHWRDHIEGAAAVVN